MVHVPYAMVVVSQFARVIHHLDFEWLRANNVQQVNLGSPRATRQKQKLYEKVRHANRQARGSHELRRQL